MPTTKMHQATTPPAACSSAFISATLLVTLLVRLPKINGKAVTPHCLHKNLRLKREEAVCQGECFGVFIVEFDNWLDTSFIHRNIRASQALSFNGLPSLDLVRNDSSERKSRHKSAGNSKDSIWRMKNLQK